MWTAIGDFGRELRYATRVLRASPLFTLCAIATLGLGIGANTAIFSVMNAVVLRNLPVHDPKQLVFLHIPSQPDGAGNTGDSSTSFSEPVFERLRQEHAALSDLMAYVPLALDQVSIRSGTVPEQAAADMVSGNFFTGIGVQPVCGRVFRPEDERTHATYAVLSYSLFQRRFRGDCAVIGQPLVVKSVPFTIIGVAAKSFTGVEGRPTDLWIPLQDRPDLNAWGTQGDQLYHSPKWWCLRLIGRLAPGVSETQALARLQPVLAHAAYEPLGGKPGPREKSIQLSFAPARGVADGESFQKPLNILMAMVRFVLLIACGNVSMLILARNSARQREFSLRMALGGSLGQMLRQLLAESVLLLAASTAVGLLLALLATRALAAWSELPASLAPDATVLWFALGISLAAALAFGLIPLVSTSRIPIVLALKNASATAFRDRAKQRTGAIVAALQVALCLVILVGGGLLVETLRQLEKQDLGFRTSGLLVFGVSAPTAMGTDVASQRFFESLRTRLSGMPGVEGATLMGNRLGSGWSNNTGAWLDGKRPEGGYGEAPMRWNNVGADYFHVLGIPLLRGRDFTAADTASAPKVAVINETFAKKYFKGREAIGHQVSFTDEHPYTVVGVAADSKYTSVREEKQPMAYFPCMQLGGPLGDMHVELRTAGDPSMMLPVVRREVAAMAPDAALIQPMTQRAQFDKSISDERLLASLAIAFGVLAIVLVATGLYGTIAYAVTRRTSEVGIRMALGAQRWEVLWMVLRESLAVCVAGLVVGVPLALALGRFMASMLYGVKPEDPRIVMLALGAIVGVSLLASLVPARRAAGVDPMVALRHE